MTNMEFLKQATPEEMAKLLQEEIIQKANSQTLVREFAQWLESSHEA